MIHRNIRFLGMTGVLALVVGCATTSRQMVHPSHPPVALEAFLQQHPLEPGANIRADEIHRGEQMSVHAVQIRDRESPHVHTRYDLSVVVAAGQGILHMAGVERPMRAGDAAFIPRGTAHHFVNRGDEPAVAIVHFAPAFTGADNVPAE